MSLSSISFTMSRYRRAEKPIYFAKEDKLEFLNIISKYQNYFEGNNWSEYSSEYKLKKKRDIWNIIEQEYNETSPKTGARTADQLQTLYKNLKRKAKKDALREIERYKSTQAIPVITAEEFANQITKNFSEKTQEDETEENSDYQILVDSPKDDHEDITEISHPSTSAENNDDPEEILVEPVINMESLQNAVRSKRYRSCYSFNHTPKMRTDPPQQLQSPVSNNRRFVEEQYKLKLKVLKTNYEAKKREAAINHEICLIQKEVAWKHKENAILEKKIKLEEMQEKKALMKLQQENEQLKMRLLKLEIEKFEKSESQNPDNKE